MIGLLFWCFIALWFISVLWLARKLTSRMRQGAVRMAAVVGIIVLSIVLPLADEIVGGLQLKALCTKNSLLKVDAERIRGNKVRVTTDPANKPLDGTAVRILYSRSSYRDVETNEELASADRYVADGGWLIRTLSMDKYIVPLTFSSTCSGGGELADYDFTLVK